MFYIVKNKIKVIFKQSFKKKILIRGHISTRTKFNGYNKVGRRSVFDGEMGIGSYIGDDCYISGFIGNFTSIGSNVRLIQGFHPTNKFVSTSPSFYSTLKQNFLALTLENKFDEFRYIDQKKRFAIKIGHDVWIGSDVLIIAGVEVGNGAVIGAGTIVTKDIKPYEIVVGNPAKKIGTRFDDDTIDFLEKFKWWNKDIDWLKKNNEYFDDIKTFHKIFMEK